MTTLSPSTSSDLVAVEVVTVHNWSTSLEERMKAADCDSYTDPSAPLPDPRHEDIFQYFKEDSPVPYLYDFWKLANFRLFDGTLRPQWIGVEITNYGVAIGNQKQDRIIIHPQLYKNEWPVDKKYKVIVHEMCHQADVQEGIKYGSTTRCPDVHYTREWANRINSVMEKLGEQRRAHRIRKDKGGDFTHFAADHDEILANQRQGFEILERKEMKCWEPLSLDPVLRGSFMDLI